MGVWGKKKIKAAGTWVKKLLSSKQGYKIVIQLRCPPSPKTADTNYASKDYLIILQGTKKGYEITAKAGSTGTFSPKSRVSAKKNIEDFWQALKYAAHLVNRKVNKKKRQYKVVLEWFNEDITQHRYDYLMDLQPCEMPHAKDPLHNVDWDMMIRINALELV